jgi:hypothetical protein
MIVFILGNGRSGTHFVAELINSSGKFEYNGEEEPMFTISCRLNILGEKDLLPKLIDLYKDIEKMRKNKILGYIDKCHPNLFIAEKLRENIKDAVFICISRSLEGTTQSMLKHEGCMSWFKKVTNFPNKYLGLESIEETKSLTNEELIKKRWLAHQQEIEYLKSKKYNNFFFFDYDNRQNDAKRLDYFLRIKTDKSIIR